MRYTHLLVWMLILALAPSLAWTHDLMLAERDRETLNNAALEAYIAGENAMDRILYLPALEKYKEAAALDPAHVPIRFLIAELAVRESRKRLEQPALDLLRTAESALVEVVDMGEEVLLPSQMREARTELAAVRNMIVRQAERDQRAQRIGKLIVQERVRELYPEPKKVEPKPELAEEDAARQAGPAAARGRQPAAAGARQRQGGGMAPLGVGRAQAAAEMMRR